MTEPLTIHFTLVDTLDVVESLKELEERWAEEPGFWGVPSGDSKIDHIETVLLVEEELYDTMSRDDLYKFLGLEPSWVVESYEV